MPNVKKITSFYTDSSLNLYAMIRQRGANNYLLDDATGLFTATNPADPYLALAEHDTIKKFYEVNESRQVWDNGIYDVYIYNQIGGSPSPTADDGVKHNIIEIKDDEIVTIKSIRDDMALQATLTGKASQTSVNDLQASVNARPTNPVLTNDARLNNLDTAISTRSTLTAQQVWEYATRTLSSLGTLIADIWAYATRTITDKTEFRIAGTKTKLDDLNDISMVTMEASPILAKEATVSVVATKMDLVWKIEKGTWQRAGSQIIMYDTDGISPFITFNIYDENGDLCTNPSNVFRREPTI